MEIVWKILGTTALGEDTLPGFGPKTIFNLGSFLPSLSKRKKATSKWLGWIRKTMHVCGLSQFQQQVKLLAGLKWTSSELLGTVLKFLGNVFCGSWVAHEENWLFVSTHNPMWVTTMLGDDTLPYFGPNPNHHELMKFGILNNFLAHTYEASLASSLAMLCSQV